MSARRAAASATRRTGLGRACRLLPLVLLLAACAPAALVRGDGFALRVPAGWEAIGAGGEAEVRAGSYIPACGEGFLACVRYLGEEREATTLESAGLGIHRRAAADAASCEATPEDRPFVGDVRRETLGGVDYLAFTTGEAAMNHVARDEVFRAWRGGRCWELVARIGATNVEVYPPGAIAEFGDAQREALRATLRGIVASVALAP